MNFKRKGQSATEYLMTYGWAILAITIVGALLYTQVFSNKSCTNGANGWDMTSNVVPVGNQYSLAADGTLSIGVVNRLDTNVTVQSVTIDSTVVEVLELNAGQDGSLSSVAGVATAATVGDCYTKTVTITYDTDLVDGLKSTGTISGRYA
ncbi:hypothetical protein GQ473_05570 [archaeon]|nr:hypothetical protein [archaeon]